jgi:hypothetical protein
MRLMTKTVQMIVLNPNLAKLFVKSLGNIARVNTKALF